MNASARETSWTLGLLGAAVGGALGYLAFFWIAGQGFYGLVLPGAALGFGCELLSGGKSYGLGIVCGLLALVLGLLTEWRFAPFVADGSLSYFLTHLGDLKAFTLMSLAAGGLFAFWFGRGRARLLGRRRGGAAAGENNKNAANQD